jgi:hypothetical protein
MNRFAAYGINAALSVVSHTGVISSGAEFCRVGFSPPFFVILSGTKWSEESHFSYLLCIFYICILIFDLSVQPFKFSPLEVGRCRHMFTF